MSTPGQHRVPEEPVDDPTIGRLVADATRDISLLVQAEIALAKSELKVSVKNAGLGAGLLAGAGFIGLLIIVLASITIAQFLAKIPALDLAWGYLIVTVFYLFLAVVLALLGVSRLKKIRAPEKTIATAKEIPNALKGKS